MAKNNATTLDQFKDKNYGKVGAEKRNKLETGFLKFKTEALIHDVGSLQSVSHKNLADNESR